MQTRCLWLISRYKQPLLEFSTFLPVACEFNAIVFATFPDQHGQFIDQLLAEGCPGQNYVFVVHNPGEVGRRGVCHCLAQVMRSVQESWMQLITNYLTFPAQDMRPC